MSDDKEKGEIEIDLSNRTFENSPEKPVKIEEAQEEYNDPNRWSNSKMMDRSQTPYIGSTIQLQDINFKEVPGGSKQMMGQGMYSGNVQESFKNQGFQKSCCLRETCTWVRRTINVIGCLLAVPNVALDLAYIAKSTFYNKAFFATLIIIVLLRIVIIVACFQCYLFFQLAYKPPLSVSDAVENDEGVEQVDEKGKKSRRYQQVRQHGMSLYLSMNALMLFGTFRLLPSLYFPLEVSVGFAIELIFNLFPTFLVQMFNNSDMPGLLSGIQSASLIIKIFLILIFIVEIIIAIWEIGLNRKMRKLKVPEYEKISEEERRRIHSKKFGLVGLVSAFCWLVVLIICLAAASGRYCDVRHAMEMGVCVPCQDPLCDSCLKNSQVCEECPESRNGTALFLSQKGLCRKCDIGCQECVDDGKNSTKCTKCEQNFYLSKDKYCRQCLDVGCISCTDKAGASLEQICNKCDDKYYLSSIDQKCYQCNPGCNKCSDKGDGTQQCDECLNGHYLKKSDKQCKKCRASCLDCQEDPTTGDEICNTCAEGFKLDPQTKSCEDCFQVSNVEQCGVCDIAGKKCEQCKLGFALDTDTNKCVKCSSKSPNCVKCSIVNKDVKCEQCDTQIASMDSSGQCLNCKEGWDKIGPPGNQQCYCQNILNTHEGYKCQKCSDLIEDCAKCKYTLEPENKLQYFVGKWNHSHSAKTGVYEDPDQNPVGSQHVICTQAGPGLVAVPVDGQYIIKKCEEVFKGCTKCADKGLSCDTCEEWGWYRYRSGANNRCGLCTKIPNRPGMEHCEKCNQFVCTQCKEGYHQLMGGCFKCYFDWQCSYFD